MATVKTILLATDYGEASESAMSTAFELALALNATVHVVHAFTVEDNMEADNFSQAQLAELQLNSSEKLEALARGCTGAERLGSVVSRFGEPAALVLSTAEELQVDMIVLGSNGRQGISRLLLGSVAETVVRQAKCSVLVAKPTPPSSEGVAEAEKLG